MESCFEVALESRTGPRVTAQVQRVLMAFSFVLVLEAVMAILAVILFFSLMLSGRSLDEKLVPIKAVRLKA